MAYTRFSGSGPAFGWRADTRITVGGLRPHTAYTLECERDSYPLHTDAQGACSGQVLHGTPLCVALDGQPVLYDESRVNAISAAAMLAARKAPRRQAPEAAPADEAREADKPPEKKPEEVVYRQPSAAEPVDALPALSWPPAAEKLRPYFAENQPVRLLEDLSWRTVRSQEGGVSCCFGYRASGDRVSEVLYGVRARGSMVPPRGLQGYGYERMLDGSGYWTLRQRV